MSSSFRPDLSDLEVAYASTGTIPKEAYSSTAVRAWAVMERSADYRRSEVLARVESRDPLQLLRALISRGNTDEAAVVLTKLKQSTLEPSLLAEVLLEESRLYAALGEWVRVTQTVTTVLQHSDLSGLSQMAAHQVRANAWLELQDLRKAGQDLQRLEAYATLYSFGQLSFYGEVLKLKLRFRTDGVLASAADFARLLRVWSGRVELSNGDELLTLLRLKIDELRLQRKSFGGMAIAAAATSAAIGDEIYLGLSWVDVWSTASDSMRVALLPRLQPFLELHPRVRRLWEEVHSSKNESSLMDSSCRVRGTARGVGFQAEALPVVLHCLDSGVTVDLKTLDLRRAELQPRMVAILRALAEGPLPKEHLFHRAWGVRRYQPERHDGLIRTALHRLREQSGLCIESNEGVVALAADSLVVSL